MEELESIPDIGPARAAQIIANRSYSRVEDLERVHGLGHSLIQSLRPYVKVDGATEVIARQRSRTIWHWRPIGIEIGFVEDDAEPVHEEGRIGYRTLTQPRFTAWLRTPFNQRPGEFGAVFLFVFVDLPAAISAAVIQASRWKTMYAHVDMNRHGRLAATHTLVVCGGITEYYLRDQLQHWQRDLERLRNEVRKQTRLLAGSTVHQERRSAGCGSLWVSPRLSRYRPAS